jgi:hypothetical protein
MQNSKIALPPDDSRGRETSRERINGLDEKGSMVEKEAWLPNCLWIS